MSIYRKLLRPVKPPSLAEQAVPESLIRHEGRDGSKGEHTELPLVTIITVVLNARETLGRTLSSVANLSYPRIEHILIDGGSTDGSAGIIRVSETVSAWSNEPDMGIYDAMNKGVAAARGDYIAMLNADDWYEPQTIECAVQSLRTSGHGFVYGDLAYYMPGTGKRVRRAGDPDYTRSLPGKVPATWHPTMVCKREMFETVGLYRTDMKVAADLDWQVRAFNHGFRGVYDPRVVTHHWGGGISSMDQCLAIQEGFVCAMAGGSRSPRVLSYWMFRYAQVRFPKQCKAIRRYQARLQALSHKIRSGTGALKNRLPFKPHIKLILGPYLARKAQREIERQQALQTGVAVETKPDSQARLLAFASARDACGLLSDSALEMLVARAPSWSSVCILDPDNRADGIRTLLEHMGVSVSEFENTTPSGSPELGYDLVIAPDWSLEQAAQTGARECIVTDDGPYSSRVPLLHDDGTRRPVMSLCLCHSGV